MTGQEAGIGEDTPSGFQKDYSKAFPRVSGSCVAINDASKNATAQIQNAHANPLLSPTRPMV